MNDLAFEARTLPQRIRDHAIAQPAKLAIADEAGQISYAELDRLMDRFAAALQRDGVAQRRVIVSVADTSIAHAVVFLGSLRAGCVAAPIQPSATPDQIRGMIADADAAVAFLDEDAAALLENDILSAKTVCLDPLDEWLAPANAVPEPVEIEPEDRFNIIYSSGTTGTPKGIVQSHAMRLRQFASYVSIGFGSAVTLIATPLYSNTTLVAFLPTLAFGGSVVLMRKFDARRYLELAERHRATHTMLVPIQYQRIMAVPDFDRFDLSAFRFKTCTSAPFKAEQKADVVKRWPGALVEFYGMTEGGGSTVLYASEHPYKLHTVGQPAPGHDLRLIDEDGREVGPGETGEVVSRSDSMMNAYHGRVQATRDATWLSPEGERFIRHGDMGRFDEDGFLTLMDRKKDMIISGGFNIYPLDLEAVLLRHPAVVDCAVVGVFSERWGETPVGFYVPAKDATATSDKILAEVNAQLGRTQRLSTLHEVDELPRSGIGKILKRDLREQLAASTTN